MSVRKFCIAWIVSSVLMFGISYLWHGVLLNDFNRLSYPKEIFLTVAAIVYLVIGFAVVKVYLLKILLKAPSKLIKGAAAGIFCGIIFYMIALVVGVSFSTELKLKYILADMGWQAVEQGIGGIAVGLIGMWVHDYTPEDIQ